MRSLVGLCMVLPVAAVAQTDIDSRGDCNQIIPGSGNNVTVNCTIIQGGAAAAPPADTSVEVVVNFSGGTINTYAKDNWGVLQPFYPDLSFVDQFASGYQLELAGTRYAFALSGKFEGGFQTLKTGKHRYTMRTNVVYFNGFRSEATCRGVLDLQSEASLTPRQHVEVFPDGQIASLNCGFIANQ